MSWRRYRTSGDPDPIVYLGPIGVLALAGALSPRVEAVLNLVIGLAFAVVVAGTVVYVVWAFWGPRPEPEEWAAPAVEVEADRVGRE